MPTSTAMVRSAITVSANVTIQTERDALSSRTIVPISRHSPMLYATIIKIAASAASGIDAASGARKSSTAINVRLWTMPGTGVSAPERIPGRHVMVRRLTPGVS
jgi:hypothetical protein